MFDKIYKHIFLEGDSESSSIESGADEDRLYLQVGEQLKQILDFDREMIVRRNKQHILPAELPAVRCLIFSKSKSV